MPTWRDSIRLRVAAAGLGLSVVRHVVEALGGKVSVESDGGRGSAFTLHLPAARSGETA